MQLLIFLVRSPRHPETNVIVTANNREMAKQLAVASLGGDTDQYEVTPLTKIGDRTVFITVTEAVQSSRVTNT